MNSIQHRPFTVAGPCRCLFIGGLALQLLLVGCGKKEEVATIKTRETENAKEEIKKFEKNNSAEQKGEVELAFSQLDQEIHELEVRVEKTDGDARAEAMQKLEALRQRKAELKKDFTEAKFKALMNDIKSSVR